MNLTKTTILIKTDKAIKESAQKTAEKLAFRWGELGQDPFLFKGMGTILSGGCYFNAS